MFISQTPVLTLTSILILPNPQFARGGHAGLPHNTTTTNNNKDNSSSSSSSVVVAVVVVVNLELVLSLLLLLVVVVVVVSSLLSLSVLGLACSGAGHAGLPRMRRGSGAGRRPAPRRRLLSWKLVGHHSKVTLIIAWLSLIILLSDIKHLIRTLSGIKHLIKT